MRMIRDLFFPRLIKNKPLFSLTRVGIHIDTSVIQVAHIKSTRTKQCITALEEYQINPGDARTYAQRVGATLKKITPKIEKDAEIVVTFSSTKVVIKELTLPFLDPEKIRMVIEYEIEPIIPFKLENAIVDFIIISQSEVKESSTVMVIAAQKEEVKKVIELLHKADIEPRQITIDLFSIISLFNHIPTYSKLKHAYAVVDIAAQSTRVALINNQTMTANRTLLKGSDLPLKASDEVDAPITIDAHREKLFNEIAFTLNSFEIKHSTALEIEKIFFIGTPELFKAFDAFAKKSIHKPCEEFATEQLSSSGIESTITIQPETWRNYSRIIGTVIAAPRYADFTLRRKDLEWPVQPLLTLQLITASIIAGLILSTLGGLAYLQIVEGQEEISMVEKKEIKRLRSALPSDSPGAKKTAIKALAKEVETYIEEQEDLWSTFSAQRLRPLEILQELGTIFNKKKFDLEIEHIIISGDDNQPHPIEVKGIFRSKTSPGKEDFKHFSELATDIEQSKTLMLTEEVDPSQLPNKGVSFIAHFKPREGVL